VLVAGGTAFNLPAAAEALIGRADPVSNFMPQVDLGPYGALEHGVGRRHARLFVQQGQLMVEDLDSTNGSFLNNTKLAPRQAHPLRSGDELRLGTLKLRVEG
jgi:pSer/pThr/pTyr-binding forkhead associated (FHA) protein